MVYAWVLIMAMFSNNAVAISGIASQAECERLAKEIPMYSIGGHQCFRYQIVK